MDGVGNGVGEMNKVGEWRSEGVDRMRELGTECEVR